MANLIILEGVSRTGKSTLTKLLSEKLGYRHISIKDKSPEYIENLPDFYQGMHVISQEFFRTFPDETFILDRSFLSELVYSKSFNRSTYVKQGNYIQDLLHDNNFILVNLVTTHTEYLNRTPKDLKIYSYKEFNKQKDLFYFFFETYKTYYDSNIWKNRFLEIDTNESSIEECFHLIARQIEKNTIKTIEKI
jgi:thymidylate kinase